MKALYMGLVLLGVLISGFSVADDQATAATEEAKLTAVTEQAPPAPTSKIVGAIDVRPTWTTKSGKWGTENLIMGGYQFNPNTKLQYTQLFTTNIFTPHADKGLQLAGDYGIVQLILSKLYVSPNEKLTIGYEPRIYLPTLTSARDAGMIFHNRHILKVAYQATPNLTLQVQEIPIFLVYNRAGSVSDGTASANPWFENRVYFMADYNITSKLSVSMNLLLHQTRNRAYSVNAENDDKWTFVAWTYPELNYALTSNSTVGIAYYSDNLIKSGGTVGEGLEKGAVQLSFAATL